MPSFYIVLEKEISNTDIYVNGNFLSKNNQELETMAEELGVSTLMGFFSISRDELTSLMGEEAFNSTLNNAKSDEKWFTTEEGLRTVHAC